MKEQSHETKSTWLLSVFKKKPWNPYLIGMILLGLVLLLLPGRVQTTARSQQTQHAELEQELALFSVEAQEEKLAGLLCDLQGAGEVRVMLTLKSGTERVYLKDVETSSAGENEDARQKLEEQRTEQTVLVTESGTENAVLQKYLYPEYMGALVMAEGADQPSVRLQLVQAVSALTGLGTDKITVIKMKSS